MPVRSATLAVVLAVAVSQCALADAFIGAKWINRGPANLSGLVTALLIDPDDPDTWIAATGGGLFVTTNAGAEWTAMEGLAGRWILALARDPKHHDVLWAGMLANRRDETLYRSDDRGRSWTPVAAASGLSVDSVAVSPTTSTVLIATEFGVLASADGVSWRTTPFASQFGSRVLFHPTDGNRAIAIAGRVAPYRMSVFVSSDGAATWHEAQGIDYPSAQGIDVAFLPQQPTTVFAYVTGKPYVAKGALYRSDDSAETFHHVGDSGNTGDYMRVISLFISPVDPNLMVNGAIRLFRSTDGGVTDQPIEIDGPSGLYFMPHPDYSGIVADPRYSADRRRIILWGDGGVYATDDIAAANLAWTYPDTGLVNAQIYSIDVGASGTILYGMQDIGIAIQRSGSAFATKFVDGDAMRVVLDPIDETVNYFVGLNPGFVYRSARLQWLINTSAGRTVFAGDFVIDPNEPTRMFAGSAIVVRAEGIQSDPVVTTVRADNGTDTTAIAVQRGNSNVVWLGDSQGSVYRTENALSTAPVWQQKASFTSLSTGPIRRILIDADDPMRVLVVSGAAVMVTRDGGLTWRSITATAPPAMVANWISDVARHPQHPDWVYVATPYGLWSTADGGATWTVVTHPVLRTIRITALRFAPGTSTLVVATYGRGAWSADIPASVPKRRAIRR